MKFFVTFNIPSASIQEWMSTVDEATRKEQTEKMMADWKTWMEDHKDSIVDPGLPVGKTKRVTKAGIADAKNDLNWFLIVEADSQDAAADMFKDHPHLQIPSCYIDVSGTAGMGMN